MNLEVHSELEAQMLAAALEHYYYIAREEYADGSGEASPEQLAVGALQQRALALVPGAVEEQQRMLSGMEDAIAQSMSTFGITGIRFGDGEGFDWDQSGQVRCP